MQDDRNHNINSKPTKEQKRAQKEEAKRLKAEKWRAGAKKRKRILALVMALLIAVTGTGIGIFLKHQPDSSFEDRTAVAALSGGSGKNPLPEQSVEICDSVITVTGDEAKKANDSIIEVKPSYEDLTVTFGSAVPETIKDLGVGDVFMLEGNRDTPFEDTYFGKVEHISKEDGKLEIVSSTPSVEEVFGAINIDIDTALNSDNFISFEGLDGVTLNTGSTDSALLTDLPENGAEPMSGQSGEDAGVTLLKQSESKGEFEIDIEIDLLELFQFTEKVKEAKSVKEGFNKYYDEKHKDDKDYDEMSAKEKFDEAAEAELKLVGEVGIKDLNFKTDIDRLFHLDFSNLEFELTGKANLAVELKGNAEFDLDEFFGKNEPLKKNDKWTSKLASAKIAGLSKKLLPICMIQYNAGAIKPVFGRKAIEKSITSMPLVIGVMIYTDLSGKISFAASLKFQYEKEIDFKYHVIEDGKPTFRSEDKSKEAEASVDIKIGISADVDFTVIGASAQVYIFNINLAEIVLAELGAEAAGSLSYEFKWKIGEPPENTFRAEGYMRGYIRGLGIRLKLKIKAEFLGFISIGAPIEFEGYLFDITMFIIGNKASTHFNADKMTWGSFTATDGDLVYYKDSRGNLSVVDKRGYGATLYEFDSNRQFVKFCGIDDSYLYVLLPTTDDHGTYDLYRISRKPDSNDIIQERKLASGIATVLTMDSKNIYYTEGEFSETVYALGREDCKTTPFHTFDNDVIMMALCGDEFRVVTEKKGSIEFLFFGSGSSNKYYTVSLDGSNVIDLGSNPQTKDLPYVKYDNYYQFRKIVSSGRLRYSASEMYRSDDVNASNSKLVKSVGGWNPTEDGIFFSDDNDSEEPSAPYAIKLCDGYTGNISFVTEINDEKAIFTLTKGKHSNWYYIDKVEGELVVYELNGDFENKKEVSRITGYKGNIDLNDCSTELCGNTIYFYTMPSDNESYFVYRYTMD